MDDVDEDWGEKHGDWEAVKAQNAAWARYSVVMVRKIDAWVALAMSALQRTWHNEYEHVILPGTPISRWSLYGVSDNQVRGELIQHALWCMYLGTPLPEIKKPPSPTAHGSEDGGRREKESGY